MKGDPTEFIMIERKKRRRERKMSVCLGTGKERRGEHVDFFFSFRFSPFLSSFSSYFHFKKNKKWNKIISGVTNERKVQWNGHEGTRKWRVFFCLTGMSCWNHSISFHGVQIASDWLVAGEKQMSHATRITCALLNQGLFLMLSDAADW